MDAGQSHDIPEGLVMPSRTPHFPDKQITMRMEIITDAGQLPGIKAAWETLCGELADSISVFSSYQWYESWWRHFSGGAQLNIVAMWQGDRLIGVAPLMIRRATIHGLPATVLSFMENRQSLHNDFLVRPEHREAFLSALLRSAGRSDAPWDLIVFRNLPDSSANRVALTELLGASGKTWRKTPTWYDSPYLVPRGSWEDYLADRSPRTRKSLRNIVNSMQKAGQVSVTQIRSREEFLAVQEEVFQLARRSWAEAGGDSLASDANAAFSSELAQWAAELGWLSLWTLRLNGTLIAIEFHLRAFGKEHAVRGHYLPEYARLSPGTYLEMKIIEHAFREQDQVACYDFCGSFENYKKKWTDRYASHCDVAVFSGSRYGRLLALHETTVVPLLKRTFPKDFWGSPLFRLFGINTNRMGN
jgi:CelD/BcsL family acetyltransferase involved in cellulose biosynthesis